MVTKTSLQSPTKLSASTASQQLGSMATEAVAVRASIPQPTAKETLTLVLPISGLLGILGTLVAKIKEGEFIDLGDFQRPLNGPSSASQRTRRGKARRRISL